MAQGPDGKTIIIVKKVVGHGGHHGGSWKVAYADFVTSMMAFFMVLWLVNTASNPVRERIASYFRAPGLFEKGSGTPLELIGGSGILPDSFAPPSERTSQTQPNNRIYEVISKDGQQREIFGEGGGKSNGTNSSSRSKEQTKLEKLADQLKEEIEKDAKKIAGVVGKMEVKVDQRGLHLEIMDTPNASMFALGSAEILPEAKAELAKISKLLLTLPNPLDIEGHTDASPYKGIFPTYDNWSLSTDRANSARRTLLSAGMKEPQVARVVGYAAQKLKIPTDPLAAPNRRISISMRFTVQASEALKQIPGVVETKPQIVGGQPEEKPKETPTPEPDRQPSFTNAPSKEKAGTGLKMDLSTTSPKPEPGQAVDFSDSVETGRPVWMEKDKIFGDKNPFFQQE